MEKTQGQTSISSSKLETNGMTASLPWVSLGVELLVEECIREFTLEE
jgi:hypothetical protein